MKNVKMRPGKISRRGFTLIEILLVVGILAILASAIVLVLNPAELLRQARDSVRVADMATLRTSLILYLVTQPVGLPASGGEVCTANHEDCVSVSTSTAVDSTGWINVDFNAVPGRAPIAALPLDPINLGTTTAYGYSASDNRFELNTQMESIRYRNGGPDDVESKDGGNANDCYEAGTNLTLIGDNC